ERGNLYPEINFYGYRIAYHPTDTSRLLTTNADGIHSLGSHAALHVFGASFEGMGDDGINLHTRIARFISRFTNENGWAIAFAPGGGWGDWRAGDILHVYNPQRGTLDCALSLRADAFPCGGGLYCGYVSEPLWGTACNAMVAFDGSNTKAADQIAD